MATRNELSDYIKEGREWRDNMTSDMATLKANANEFSRYIKSCDDDRDSLGKRMSIVETHQAVNTGIVGFALTALTIVGGFLEYLRK